MSLSAKSDSGFHDSNAINCLHGTSKTEAMLDPTPCVSRTARGAGCPTFVSVRCAQTRSPFSPRTTPRAEPESPTRQRSGGCCCRHQSIPGPTCEGKRNRFGETMRCDRRGASDLIDRRRDHFDTRFDVRSGLRLVNSIVNPLFRIGNDSDSLIPTAGNIVRKRSRK